MAKKVENLQKLWQDIALRNGVPQNVVEAFSAGLGDENVVKAFRQAFVPVPEHHSTLDEAKAEAAARKAELDEWYEKNGKPAYETNMAGIERLRQYEEKYGALDSSDVKTKGDAEALGFESKASLKKYLDDRFDAERAGVVGLTKAIPKMTIDYYNRFKKVLDPNEVEKIAVKENLTPDLAYERFIAPEVEEQRKAEFEAKIKEAEERGAQKALSNHDLPVETGPKEFSPFFDRESYDPTKPPSEADQERASRAEFNDGWNNYAKEVAKQHQQDS